MKMLRRTPNVDFVRSVLLFYGLDTYQTLKIATKLVVHWLQWATLLYSLWAIFETLTGLKNKVYGRGITVFEIQRPVINICIIRYLRKSSHTLSDLIRVTISKRQAEDQDKIEKVARDLIVGWIIGIVWQMIRSFLCINLFGIEFLLEQQDYFGIIQKYPETKPLYLSLILIRCWLYDTGLMIASASLYLIIYYSIQLTYQPLFERIQNTTLSICSAKEFDDFRSRRALVNQMMASFEEAFNLLPFLWISSIFTYTSVELLYYNFTNWNGFKIFSLLSSASLVMVVFFIIVICVIIYLTEGEKSLIDRYTNYSPCQGTFAGITSDSIGRKLYFMSDRTISATVFDMYVIKRDIIWHFLGTIVTFSVMFKEMFDTEFKSLLQSMAERLNMTLHK